MKKLLIVLLVVAIVTPLSAQRARYVYKNDYSFKLGYACSFPGDGMVLNRAHVQLHCETKYGSFVIGSLIPSSQDGDFGIFGTAGPKFTWEWLRISPDFVIGYDHRHLQVGGGIQVSYKIVGPLSVFTRVQCTCPVEMPKISFGRAFTTLTFGVGIHRLHRVHPKNAVKQQ